MSDHAEHPSPAAAFPDLLHAQRVWDTELPDFDPATAPPAPLPLFHSWFAGAVAAGQTEPHAMSLATADAEGLPDVRTLLLHDADERGFHFATHATSAKGRQLAARPYAALGFYWPAQGRQVRVRGPVVRCTPAESHADLHARSTGALAAALTGAQSEVAGSVAELHRAADAAWERAAAEPDTEAPTWTRYVVEPARVEFFQGDARRRHIRLRYRRAEGGAGAGGWTRELLWP
ncbi:pyridoxal 5'-phosphate synthase [Streptomyces sp. NPDC059698]|uniref:pyridoxine/pyridoxamine 5'-phosphate oxidase n=1 Tax=unclassified Streptomyces TaxID=2593676 RepID=UPI00093FDF3D|nr:pyridoxal 5'-phosphate synthase [Streptomyces sp. CB02366]OKJ41118.1 oxidase [Streptomyces sp. CB02366]TVP33709.1 oxidase [Streptomyces griseus subsp. griseus]